MSKSTDRLYESVKKNARKQAKVLIPKKSRDKLKSILKKTPPHQIAQVIDPLLPPENKFLEMSSQSKKKQSKKASRKLQSKKTKKQHPKPRPMPKKKGGKRVAKNSFVLAAAGIRRMAPKMKTLRMGQRGGLTLNGGTITGVCEITPSLQVEQAANNVPGNILALIPIHAQTIAPGTRLSDIATLYDQYVFDDIWFELDCATNYLESGTLLGFVEANPIDPIGAVNTRVGNVTEWVDHGSAQIHPIAKGILTFPRRGSYMKRMSKGPKGGFYFNTVVPTGTAGSLSVADCFQGQFCLMIHNIIATQGGQPINYPIDLGALRVHFKLRLREAAERNQEGGAADEHYSVSTSLVTNPLGWSTTSTEQSTMQIGSNLGFQSRYVSGGYNISLPVGNYYIALSTGYTSTGTADWEWGPYGGAQTGYNIIDSTTDMAKLSYSAATTTQTTQLQVRVTTSGEFRVFVSGGTSTGWNLAGYCKLLIVAMPSGINTLLRHKDLELRSLAWVDHQQKQDQTSEVLRAVRAELGLAPKESKAEKKMQMAYKNILTVRAKQKERQLAVFEELKELKRAPSPATDDWDAKDFEDAADICDEKMLQFRIEADRLRSASYKQQRALKIVQDDEKSDRGKGPKEPSRASSLKS